MKKQYAEMPIYFGLVILRGYRLTMALGL